jgi:hypothetical protein
MSIMSDFVKTGNTFVDAIVNVYKLLQYYQQELELNEIFQYDVMMIPQCPCASIVFDNSAPQVVNIGDRGRCRSVQNVHLLIYLYLESLELGNDTMPHIKRMGRLNDILFEHNDLLGLCHTEAMSVDSVTLGGRSLDSDVYLVGQFNINVPQRFCVTRSL